MLPGAHLSSGLVRPPAEPRPIQLTRMDIFSHIQTVRFSDGDRFGRLKLRTLFDYAQEAAGHHAERLTVGMDRLQSRGQAWILSRIRLRIKHYPRTGEAIRLETYPRGFDKLFAIREFRFQNESGELFCEGTSCWLLIDREKLKILNAAAEFSAVMPDNSALPRAYPNIVKLPSLTVPLDHDYRIRESQIDINGHLNNAEYAGIVQDFIGPGVYPSEIQINYLLSVPAGSTLKVGGMHDHNSCLVVGDLDGSCAFQAQAITS